MNTTWRQCTIGDVCDTISNTYNSNAQQVVLINTSDVLEGKVLNHIYIPNENLKGQFKKTFEEGDILYSEIRPQNKRYAYIDFAPINYIASTKLMVIRNKNIVKSKYLYYFLQSDKIISELQMLAETRSGTFPQITFNELSKLSIKIPPLPEQDRIISILDSICKKIDINQQINDNLEEQAKALFKSWFVDFEPFKGGKFVDSKLGPIPEGWSIGKVNDVVQILSDFAFKSETFVQSGPYRLITIKGVQDGYLDISGASYISKVPLKMPAYCNLEIGDILLSLTGNVGRVCIVDRPNLLLNQRVAKLQPRRDKQDLLFVYILFRQDTFKNHLLQIARGTAQLNLSPVETREISIILPPANVLLEFSKIGQYLFDKIALSNQETLRLSALRDTLLPKLMSGELSVEEVSFD